MIVRDAIVFKIRPFGVYSVYFYNKALRKKRIDCIFNFPLGQIVKMLFKAIFL